jgi:hypothetical protein
LFGYIRPLESELRVRELDTYKAAYCGLCRSLAKHYGPLARWLVSYDLTFYAILYAGLSSTPPEIALHRCPYHPLKQKPHLERCSGIDVSCDLTVLLMQGKCIDNIYDSSFLFSLLWNIPNAMLKYPAHQAALRNADAAEVISVWGERQRAIEKENVGFDEACDPTATAMALIFSAISKDEKQQRILHRFGYMIGRYIYLCDAIEDLPKDAKHHRFNPLLLRPFDKEHLAALANSTLAQAFSSFALLNTDYFSALLENIVYLGLPSKINSIISAMKFDQTTD